MTQTVERATTAMTVHRPDPHTAGRRAAEILNAIEAHPDFPRFRLSTLAYPDCWSAFTGYPIIAEWDLDADGERLFVEALRTMAMKAAFSATTSRSGSSRVAGRTASPSATSRRLTAPSAGRPRRRPAGTVATR